MLIDYLHEHYDDGEPIFTEDIHIPGMNRSNFIQQLKTLTDNGKIIRYEKVSITSLKKLASAHPPDRLLKRSHNTNISAAMV